VCDRAREELFERDAVAADEQGPRWAACVGERGKAGQRLGRTTALHLDGHEAPAGPQDEVDLLVALAPVEDLAYAGRGGVALVEAAQ